VPGDGARFKGRGYIQLTGRDNYQRIGGQVGVDLIASPPSANNASVAGLILAQFLKNAESKVRNALAANDLLKARKLVNGGSHGFPQFKDTFDKGMAILPH
jgi:predicted chitinase